MRSPTLGIEPLCRVFGRTRSAYYKAEQRTGKENLEHGLIIGWVRKLRETQPYLGTEKVYHKIKPFLAEHSIKIGRDNLHKLLVKYNLQSSRRRRRAKSTNSNHAYHKYQDLTKNLEVIRPNQLYSSDITYIRRFQDFSYLSLITDNYSHKIVGWHLSKDLSTDGPVKALEMALQNRRRDRSVRLPLMHHSDRGIQYCSRAYIALLKHNKVTVSMAYASYNNPVAERINGILKTELLQDGYPTHEEALAAITRAIAIYNNERPHRSVDMLTPAEAHKLSGLIKKRWRNNNRRKKSKKPAENLNDAAPAEM